MDELHTPEVLDDTRVLTTPIFSVHSARTRSRPDGPTFEAYRLDAADWVNVIPITAEGDIVFVRQYRHGTREVTLEIPGGMVDAGESPEHAGRRELVEETGHAATAWRPLGFVHPNPALFTNRCHTWLAEGAHAVAPLQQDGHEQTRVVLLARDAVPAAIRDGRITHALVIAAFHWLALDTGR